MSFNRVILMGNLTRDPETRYTSAQKAVTAFGLAINNRWKDASGEWQERPCFVDVTIFGPRGEAFARFHKRGYPALIEGQLRQDSWDDKQTGQKRHKLHIVADGWEFVAKAHDDSQRASQDAQAEASLEPPDNMPF